MNSVQVAPDGTGRAPGTARQPLIRLAHWIATLFEARIPATRADVNIIVVLLGILAIGTAVRFWGLGDVGLHGDEETMAMPTMHIVEHGSPLLPSGMLYPRAVGQLYLMAASVQVFGESEWAFRLPSVLCGVLLIFLSWLAGRRFLTPIWNLAFTASVAFLPELIVDAQTARMYTFLLASVAGYMLCLFEWERSNRLAYLAAAVLLLLVGVQFHTLAVFAAFMVFFPGVVRGDLRMIVAGGVAFALIVAGFIGIDHWISNQYPASDEVYNEGDTGPGGARAAQAVPQIAMWIVALGAVGAAAVATFAVRHINERFAAISAAALVALGLLAQVAFSYHIAALLVLSGAIVAYRTGRLTWPRVVPVAVAIVALAIAHVLLLKANGVPSLRQIFGAMTGRPSVWPYLAIAGYSIPAALLFAGGLVAGFGRLARRKPVPDFVLLAVLGVWIPLMLIGVFRWNVPLRYTAVQILPMLLVAFAAARWLFSSGRFLASARAQAIAAVVTCLVVIDPVALARTVNSGYATHPDHQGAANFIQSQKPGPRDILIAEDVLQQTYYLGHVDYWLEARDVAGQFIRKVDGRWRDFYTNTPLIGTGEELRELMARPDRGAIYVIGSGENQHDGRRYFRGPELAPLLESPQFKVVYRGRDGLTTVLKLPAPGAAE
jgi:hypothetical protein